MTINNRVWIIMMEQQEFVGTLRGFDNFMNIVLDDVKEYAFDKDGKRIIVARLGSILLQGTHVVMLVPASEPEDDPDNQTN
jgi:U6 snRNA-associated Sm-like protein LSm5